MESRQEPQDERQLRGNLGGGGGNSQGASRFSGSMVLLREVLGILNTYCLTFKNDTLNIRGCRDSWLRQG